MFVCLYKLDPQTIKFFGTPNVALRLNGSKIAADYATLKSALHIITHYLLTTYYSVGSSLHYIHIHIGVMCRRSSAVRVWYYLIYR